MKNLSTFQEVTLKGKSQKGKQRVKQHGSQWIAEGETESVLFPTKAPGPFVFVRSSDGQDFRWVSTRDDPDFELTFNSDEEEA